MRVVLRGVTDPLSFVYSIDVPEGRVTMFVHMFETLRSLFDPNISTAD